jgi:snoRNA binding domain, fibrillarin
MAVHGLCPAAATCRDSHQWATSTATTGILQVLAGCSMALSLDEDRADILRLVQTKMGRIAPNLSAVVGTAIAAQLMGVAGGLASLSQMPACNIQVRLIRLLLLECASTLPPLASAAATSTASPSQISALHSTRCKYGHAQYSWTMHGRMSSQTTCLHALGAHSWLAVHPVLHISQTVGVRITQSSSLCRSVVCRCWAPSGRTWRAFRLQQPSRTMGECSSPALAA